MIDRTRWIGYLLSVGLHAFGFAAGGGLLIRPPEYGIKPGSGGIDVELVAAPAEAPPEGEPIRAKEEAVEAPPPAPKDPEDAFPVPVQETPAPPGPRPEDPVPPSRTRGEEASPVRGDGSSPVPGQDPTAARSDGGGGPDAKPGYLTNPAPAYPAVAVQNGWEGLVLLRVLVGASGRVVRVEVEESSGHKVLDEAALKAVRSWRFRPAQVGGFPVESPVQVPIRFRLEDGRR